MKANQYAVVRLDDTCRACGKHSGDFVVVNADTEAPKVSEIFDREGRAQEICGLLNAVRQHGENHGHRLAEVTLARELAILEARLRRDRKAKGGE